MSPQPARALPDKLLPAHRALARRVGEHSRTIAVLRSHDVRRSSLQGREDGGWEVLCSCARRLPILDRLQPWQDVHAAHVASSLAADADAVMRELAAIAWPDDPSPLEEGGFAAGRRAMLDDILSAMPPGGPYLADLIATMHAHPGLADELRDVTDPQERTR